LALNKYLSAKKSALFMAGGLIIFTLYLYFYIGIPKIAQVLVGINTAQYALFYSLALFSTLSSVFFWSIAWNTILKSLKVNVSYRRAYLYYWAGYFTDLVLPCATVCGEVTRLYLVNKETNEDYGALAVAAIANRIVAYTVVIVGLYSGAIFIFSSSSIPSILTSIFIIFLLGVTAYYSVLLYISINKRASRILTDIYLKIIKILRPKLYSQRKIEKIQQSLEAFYQGFATFRKNPKLLLKPLVFHMISYLLGIVVYVFIFFAIGIFSVPIQFYIVVFFIATAVQDVIASFSVGSLDILLVAIFSLYGIATNISAVTATILRSASFWFPLLVGFVSVQLIGARNILSTRKLQKRQRILQNTLKRTAKNSKTF
jgi:glycosyltransferase 2 family protein